MAVSGKFAYDSLFEVARDAAPSHRLTPHDLSLFRSLATTNFELVLSALSTARRVAEALGHDATELRERHESIRSSLVHAVHEHHLAWSSFSLTAGAAIHKALLAHRAVYSTNYDLLLYWAMMQEPSAFKDFFWGGTSAAFEPENTELWKTTDKRVLFLHGGLHLFTDESGVVRKRTHSDWRPILQSFEEGEPDEAAPLFVAEGTASEKLNAIHRSPYLTFAFSQLKTHQGGLVVFGSSLSAPDEHICDAINGSKTIGSVAISMRSSDPAKIIEAKAAVKSKLPKKVVHFFDAATHPLGSSEIACPEAPPIRRAS